jgi:hypothetical protein
MNATASYEINREYFAESYSEWLLYRSRCRKWQRHIAVVLALGGAMLIFFSPLYLGWVLLVIALIEGIEYYWYPARWVAQRMKTRSDRECIIEMRFEETGFYSKGPTSNGFVSWEGVRSVSETPKGLFFICDAGTSIYIPKRAIVPAEAVAEIARLAAHKP